MHERYTLCGPLQKLAAPSIATSAASWQSAPGRAGARLEVRVGDAAGQLAEQRLQHPGEFRRLRDLQHLLQLAQEQNLRCPSAPGRTQCWRAMLEAQVWSQFRKVAEPSDVPHSPRHIEGCSYLIGGVVSDGSYGTRCLQLTPKSTVMQPASFTGAHLAAQQDARTAGIAAQPQARAVGKPYTLNRKPLCHVTRILTAPDLGPCAEMLWRLVGRSTTQVRSNQQIPACLQAWRWQPALYWPHGAAPDIHHQGRGPRRPQICRIWGQADTLVGAPGTV